MTDTKLGIRTIKEEFHYTLRIFTMSNAKGGGILLKTVRDMKSDFTLTAQT